MSEFWRKCTLFQHFFLNLVSQQIRVAFNIDGCPLSHIKYLLGAMQWHKYTFVFIELLQFCHNSKLKCITSVLLHIDSGLTTVIHLGSWVYFCISVFVS